MTNEHPPSKSAELMDGLKGIVQYRRKDGCHGWIPMAAYDTEHMAQRYAFKCGLGNSASWPWAYRAVDLAGEVLPPLDAEEQERMKAHEDMVAAALRARAAIAERVEG